MGWVKIGEVPKSLFPFQPQTQNGKKLVQNIHIPTLLLKYCEFLPFSACDWNGNDDFLPLSKTVFKSQIEELCGGKIFGLYSLTIHSQFRWFLEIRGYRSFEPLQRLFLVLLILALILLPYRDLRNFWWRSPGGKGFVSRLQELLCPNWFLPNRFSQLVVVPPLATFLAFLLLHSRDLGISSSCWRFCSVGAFLGMPLASESLPSHTSLRLVVRWITAINTPLTD